MNCQQVLKVNVIGRIPLTQRLSRSFHHMWPSISSRTITTVRGMTERATFQHIPATRTFLKYDLMARRLYTLEHRSLRNFERTCLKCDIMARRLYPHQHGSLRSFETTCNLASPKEVVQFNLSDIGEGIGEVTIKEWFVEVGSAVKQFDPICEVQSDKASVTITSRFDGTIKKLYHGVDSMAKVGLPLVDIETESSNGPVVDEMNGETGKCVGREWTSSVSSCNLESYKKTLATPAVRRVAQEYNVNLSVIQGTGKHGRVLKEDILAFIQSNSNPNSGSTQSDLRSQSSPSTDPSRLDPMYQTSVQTPKVVSKNDRTEQLTPIQKAMFKSMTVSNTIPQFGLSDEIDMSAFLVMKPFLKQMSADHNVQIRPLSFMIKATSMALHHFPILNSVLSDSGSTFGDAANVTSTYKSDHNIGFAMDTPSGLIVPNIKHVQDLSIVDISRELLRLQGSGKSGKLNPSDLSNGTFTLSNIGSIGGMFGIPLLMPPEVAIGAVGKIRAEPRCDKDGSIVPKHVMTVVWSADHRIIDGATMTRFNNLWKKYLERPESLLIQLK